MTNTNAGWYALLFLSRRMSSDSSCVYILLLPLSLIVVLANSCYAHLHLSSTFLSNVNSHNVCGVHSMCDQYQYLLAILLHSLHSLFTYSFVVRMFATSSPLAHMTHMTLFYTSLSLSLSLSRLQSCLLYSLLDMAHTERDCYSMTQRSYCSLSISLSLSPPPSLSPRCLSLLVHLLSISLLLLSCCYCYLLLYSLYRCSIAID
jgi:hypothetical protein